ncbi:hypothetical protein QTP88_004938 [Uroleucon formosanum]
MSGISSNICYNSLSPSKTVLCRSCSKGSHPTCTELKSLSNFNKLKQENKSWSCSDCQMNKEIEYLRLNPRCLNLELEMEKLHSYINFLEQDKLVNNIEITGIPLTDNENTFELIKTISNKLNIELDDKKYVLLLLPCAVTGNWWTAVVGLPDGVLRRGGLLARYGGGDRDDDDYYHLMTAAAPPMRKRTCLLSYRCRRRPYVLSVCVCACVCVCVCRYCRLCSRVCRRARRQRSNVLAALQFVRDKTRAQFVASYACSSRSCFSVVFFPIFFLDNKNHISFFTVFKFFFFVGKWWFKLILKRFIFFSWLILSSLRTSISKRENRFEDVCPHHNKTIL